MKADKGNSLQHGLRVNLHRRDVLWR